ncbi:MAG: ribosome maturation factor RimP [Candidatus Omnitrophica bacterium]|nr:ribosome maturation factor RimP [Candidatus Omnitrophota bacterium]
MDREAIQEELRFIIIEYLENKGLDLVDLIYRYEGRDLFLRILVDLPQGGISVGDCAQVNKEIGEILDEKNMLEGSYILEVSSPGLDRPLKTKSDFLRCLGKKIRFFLSEPVNGRIEWEGLISTAGDDTVVISSGETSIGIPLAKINKAKQVL